VKSRSTAPTVTDMAQSHCNCGDGKSISGRGSVGVVNLAVLACVLRETTKKGHQLFEEKVHFSHSG